MVYPCQSFMIYANLRLLPGRIVCGFVNEVRITVRLALYLAFSMPAQAAGMFCDVDQACWKTVVQSRSRNGGIIACVQLWLPASGPGLGSCQPA